MRKALFLISIPIIIFIAIFIFWPYTIDKRNGWDKYIEILQKQMKGLSPYWMPNSQDGPGTILENVNGAQQLFLSAKLAFPKLIPDTSYVPIAFTSEITSIIFKVGANANDKQIIPYDIETATNNVCTNNTELSFSINSPKIVRIGNELLTQQLKNFDLSNSSQEDILKKLLEPNAILISGALLADGFVFTFNNVSKLDGELEASLLKDINKTNLKYKKVNDNRFVIKVDKLIYLAYYAYPIKQDELFKLYTDLKNISKINDTKKRIAFLENSIKNSNYNTADLLKLKTDLQLKRKELDSLIFKADILLEKEERGHSSTQYEALKVQIKNEGNILDKINSKINKCNNMLISRNKYIAELQSLKSTQNSQYEELKNFQNRDYKILGNEVIIPSNLLRKENKSNK